MADIAACSDTKVYQLRVKVYQLRVVIAGISPLIRRRLEVPADTTIAVLHAVLQTVFGWSGEHLHRFVIHGCEYGISYVGGPGFRDDARRVRLAELGYASASGSATSTTSSPPGRSTCASSGSSTPSRGGRIRAAPVGGAPAHPRTGTALGTTWSGPSRTWCSMPSPAPRRSCGTCWTTPTSAR